MTAGLSVTSGNSAQPKKETSIQYILFEISYESQDIQHRLNSDSSKDINRYSTNRACCCCQRIIRHQLHTHCPFYTKIQVLVLFRL